MWANASGVEFFRNIAKFQKRNKISSLLVYILHKTREIGYFHVVVVQIWQRNVQKSEIHVQSCRFSHYTFCCFDILFAVGSLDLDVPNISSKNSTSFLFLNIRPFYRYGGHIELTRFKEYYRMPRGHEHISFVFSSAFRDIFS